MAAEGQKRDFMSEQEFNKRVRATSSAPERDSRGDSQADMDREFQIGLNYMPDEQNDLGKHKEDIPVFDLGLSGSSEKPTSEEPAAPEDRIPQNAKVVHAGNPSPIADANTPSDTN